MNKDGELILSAQSERTQLKNKKLVTGNFFIVVSKAPHNTCQAQINKSNISSRIKRLEKKKKHSIIKNLRSQSGSQND